MPATMEMTHIFYGCVEVQSVAFMHASRASLLVTSPHTAISQADCLPTAGDTAVCYSAVRIYTDMTPLSDPGT